MTDSTSIETSPAQISPVRRLSGLWLLPILTLVVGGWLMFDRWATQGPLITIEFSSARGLEAGVTKIKTLDVDIGIVEDITLTQDLDAVLVSARIHNEFRDLLVAGSRFWIVQPEVSLTGITGLGTLISGQYLRFSPESEGEPANYFRGLEQAPLTPLGTPGLQLTLTNEGDFSFSKGDRINFQGIAVGRIEDLEFNFEDNQVYYTAFIEAPYHQLISSTTRFWKSSGIHAQMTATGFEFETGPLDSMIQGGISFANPSGQLPGETPADKALYYIYPSRSAISATQYLFSIRYWVMIPGNIGGLGVGSAVTYRGVQIGEVLRTDYIPEGQTLLDKNMEIPVLIEINPGRLGLPDSEQSLQRAGSEIDNWIQQGLTATISSQNFILGQRQIELLYDENTPNRELRIFADLHVIPSGQDTLEKFTDSIEQLISTLNNVPVESLSNKLDALLTEGQNTLLSVKELTTASAALVNDERNFALVEQINSTMNSFETLAESFSADSRANQEVMSLLQSLTGIIEEFKPFLNDLKNKPNSLILPSTITEEAVPQRKPQ
ncbi:MAG: intermembrane transport protein PqiB [Gammaproteobacteria bacterium]